MTSPLEDQIQYTIEYVDRLLETDSSTLNLSGKGVNFSDIEKELRKLFDWLNILRIHKAYLYRLDENELVSLGKTLGGIYHYLEGMKNIHDSDNPSGTRDNILQSFKNFWNNFLKVDIYEDLKSFALAQAPISTTEAEEIRKNLNAIEFNLTKRETGEFFEEVETFFIGESERYSQRAKNWLIYGGSAFIVLLVLGVLILVGLFSLFEDDQEIEIQVYIFRIGIFSPLLYLVGYMTIKNYNANTHLSIINNHRLITERAFNQKYNFSDDKEVRDLFLTEAIKTMFGERYDTGYISGKNTGSEKSIVVNVGDNKNIE